MKALLKPTWQAGGDAEGACLDLLAEKIDDDKDEDDGGYHLGETAQPIRPDRHPLLSM